MSDAETFWIVFQRNVPEASMDVLEAVGQKVAADYEHHYLSGDWKRAHSCSPESPEGYCTALEVLNVRSSFSKHPDQFDLVFRVVAQPGKTVPLGVLVAEGVQFNTVINTLFNQGKYLDFGALAREGWSIVDFVAWHPGLNSQR